MHRTLSFRPRVTIAAALAFFATGVAARDFCLLPDAAQVAAGTPFSIATRIADRFPGEPVAWGTERIVEFSITDARGRVDVENPVLGGEPATARLTLRAAGTAVIALVTDPAYIEMPAEAFEAYLKEEGHDDALKARAAAGRSGLPGRERYTRHVKTLVNTGGPNASVALSRTGLALEIVPEQDLSHLRPGAHLPVRIFYRGDPDVADQICIAGETPAPNGGHYDWCGRPDGAGRASVPIAAAGWQMIRATRMIPIRNDPKADWHSFWTTLTFHVETQES
jgi:hypothetical protein